MKSTRSPAEIRARAAQIVTEVAENGRSLELLLGSGSAAGSDRALLSLLVYGTIRWYLRLIQLLALLTGKPVEKLSPPVRSLSLVGLYQLLYTNIAPHAAVAETVSAARLLQQDRAAGLINAVLRRCQRESDSLLAQVDVDLSTATAHPRWLVEALKHDWPANYAQLLAANNEHPPLWLRVNRQRATREAYLEKLAAAKIEATPGLAPQSLRLTVPTDVRSLPGFAEGSVSVQDANAQLAAHLLGAREGDRVLDACAAPGGKACHILELQPQLAQLVALDNSPQRMKRVSENLERLKLQAQLLVADAAEPGRWWDGRPFQRILLDVPCSATGVIRRHPDVKLLRRETDIAAMALRQMDLLERLWPLVARGGRLVYASCSVLAKENAAVIGAFLERHRDVAEHTRTFLSELAFPIVDDRPGPGYALATGEAGGDGFYYACLQKSDG